MTTGRWTVPGDKSLTHRALFLAAIANGTSVIRGALGAEDAASTERVLGALGVGIAREEGALMVTGARAFAAPASPLDCGNAGTTARLLLGLLAGSGVTATVTGDASLRRRPMRRVTEPLVRMGARVDGPDPDRLPLTVTGGPLQSLTWSSPVASAQVKSAILLAGVVAGVPVTVCEPGASRDHTERMLAALGVGVERTAGCVSVRPRGRLPRFEFTVPGDPSSAAFLIGAGLLGGAPVEIVDVGLNPTRTGFLPVLERMGCAVDMTQSGRELGEPVGTITVRPGPLRGTVIEPAEVPGLVDEIPLLAVLAARADGPTEFRGVEELHVKESDRLALLTGNLTAVGVRAEAGPDWLRVHGTASPLGGRIETGGDHRMAMAFAVLGRGPGVAIELSETASPTISYPGFFDALARVGE